MESDGIHHLTEKALRATARQLRVRQIGVILPIQKYSGQTGVDLVLGSLSIFVSRKPLLRFHLWVEHLYGVARFNESPAVRLGSSLVATGVLGRLNAQAYSKIVQFRNRLL